jgi:hypothetical protein
LGALSGIFNAAQVYLESEQKAVAT